MSKILRLCKKVVNAKKLKVMKECVTDIKVSCVTTVLLWCCISLVKELTITF